MSAATNSAVSGSGASLTAPPSRLAYFAAAALALAALAALACDVPIARWVLDQQRHELFAWLLESLGRFEPFAHSAGVATILLAVFLLDGSRRRAVLRLAACAFGSGLLSNVIKLTVHRWRPKEMPNAAGVWETFNGWIPWLDDFKLAMEWSVKSFPSGHAVAAAGLAVGLSWLYPRGTWLFVMLAVLASLQRVAAGAHFPSDVFAGAALGCLVAAVCIDPRLLGRYFDRFERIA
jgi:membrane-associated phospholipid phosphatase